jgi:hypothetical protein
MNCSSLDRIKLVNPIGLPEGGQVTLAPRLETLTGRSIGLINTGKPKVEHFLAEIEALMRSKYPDVQITYVRKDFTSAKPIAHELDGKVDAVVNAWGD